MFERRKMWLAAGFVAGVALMGIPFWRLPYNHQGFVYPGLLFGLAGLAVMTAVLAASGHARLRQVFWTMVCAFPTAIAIRVAVEVAQDPTDHNLWPFELVYGFVMSAMAVVPGLLVGALARRLGR